MNQAPPKTLIKPYLRPMEPIPTGMPVGGCLKPPIRCLLCDIYGTLFISGSGDLSTARRQARPLSQIAGLLDRYHLSMKPEELFERLYDAVDQYHRNRKKIGIPYPEVRIEQIWNTLLGIDDECLMHFAVEFEMIVNPVWPMPHLKTLLEVCRQSKIRLGIISNAQFFTPWLFEWFLGQRPEDLGFDNDLIFYSYASGVAKPSPSLFKTASQRLDMMGIAAQQTVYIGNDMRKDIIPSHHAGFQTVLFAGDARSLRLDKNVSADLAATPGNMPDLVVTDFEQLIRYLT